MIKFEFKKIMVKGHGLLLLLLILLTQLVFVFVNVSTPNYFVEESKAEYLLYLDELGGQVNAEKQILLNEYQDSIFYAEQAQEELYNELRIGDISYTDYLMESLKYKEVMSSRGVIHQILNQYDYARGDLENRFIIYENGWRALWQSEDVDFMLIFTMVVFALLSFYTEFSSNMNYLSLSTQVGKEKLILSKIILMISCAAIFCIVYYVGKWIIIDSLYGMSNLTAPAQSLREFEDCSYNMTLIEWYLITGFMKIITAVTAIGLTAAIYLLFRKLISTLSIILLVLVVPLSIGFHPVLGVLFSSFYFIQSQVFFRGYEVILEDGEYAYQQISLVFFLLLFILSMIFVPVIFGLVIRFWNHNITLSLKNTIRKRKKSGLVSGIMIIMLLMSGCTNKAEYYPQKQYMSGSNTLWGTFDDNFIYFNAPPVSNMYDRQENKVIDLIRAPFPDNDSHISYLYSDNQALYYLVAFSNYYQVIRRNNTDLSEEIVYQKVFYEDREKSFLGLFKDNTISMTDVMSVDIPSAFIVWNNKLIFFTYKQIIAVDIATGSEESLHDTYIYNYSFALINDCLFFVDNNFETWSIDLNSGQKQQITQVLAFEIYAAPDGFYYTNISEKANLYFYSFESQSSVKMIDKGIRSMDVKNDELFLLFEGESTIYRAQRDCSNMLEICSIKGADAIRVIPGTGQLCVYYETEHGELDYQLVDYE